MPVVASCDDCGKIYNVSSAMVGKRVKCKACGNAFTISGPGSPAAVRAEHYEKPILSPLIMRVVSRAKPTIATVLVALVFAAVVGVIGNRLQNLWVGTLIGLPVIALLLGGSGLVQLIAEGKRTPGFYKFPWQDLGRYAIPLLLGLLLGLLGDIFVIILIRSRNKGAFESGPFYDKLARLLLGVLVIALMPLVVLGVTFEAGTFPKSRPSPLERQAAAALDSPDFGRHTRELHSIAPRLPDSFETSRAPSTADARKMQQSEQNLRVIASMVLTYRANAHKTPPTLAQLFRGAPQDLRSPFDPIHEISYIYLPANITGRNNDHVIAYDMAELESLGSTQAITGNFKILHLSRDELFARNDVPH